MRIDGLHVKNDGDALVLPRGGFGGTTVVLWTPVARSDIAWNFEKFLVGPDGAVKARFKSNVAPDDARLVGAIEASLPSES